VAVCEHGDGCGRLGGEDVNQQSLLRERDLLQESYTCKNPSKDLESWINSRRLAIIESWDRETEINRMVVKTDFYFTIQEISIISSNKQIREIDGYICDCPYWQDDLKNEMS
jgi:hypothetical protein